MMDKTTQIREKARDLLSSGTIDCFVGYEVGPRGRTRPLFVRSEKDIQKLVWNQACTHNLTRYLPEMLHADQAQEDHERIGVLVKPCDSRAVHVHLAEKQYERDSVYLVGVTCEGIYEEAGFTAECPESLQARCIICELDKPVLYDDLIGTSTTQRSSSTEPSIEAIEAKSPAERMAFWLDQFDRCILCYACRQACPMCQCPTCLFERDDSLWVGKAQRLPEKRMFHLGRAYHLAGRCVECDACQQACPMDIPIRMLNQKLVEVMKERFKHHAGLDLEAAPLATVLRGEEVLG